MNKIILKLIWKYKGIEIAEKILKKSKSQLSQFKTYYTATRMKPESIGGGINTDQRNGISNPEIDPETYSQLICD